MASFERRPSFWSVRSDQSHFTEQIKVALGLALLRAPILPAQIDPSKDASSMRRAKLGSCQQRHAVLIMQVRCAGCPAAFAQIPPTRIYLVFREHDCSFARRMDERIFRRINLRRQNWSP